LLALLRHKHPAEVLVFCGVRSELATIHRDGRLDAFWRMRAKGSNRGWQGGRHLSTARRKRTGRWTIRTS
jgi:hypothetical protein